MTRTSVGPAVTSGTVALVPSNNDALTVAVPRLKVLVSPDIVAVTWRAAPSHMMGVPGGVGVTGFTPLFPVSPCPLPDWPATPPLWPTVTKIFGVVLGPVLVEHR